jgi:NADPH:quinone reductase-like Zn-dependent oxidoreductase
LSIKTKQGALAEYVYADKSVVVRRPDNISPIQAAGILLTASTAWTGLFTIAKLEEGQSVFINGGSTAVGMYAIQFAKEKGCKVVATASGKNEEFVRSLGVDEVQMRFPLCSEPY